MYLEGLFHRLLGGQYTENKVKIRNISCVAWAIEKETGERRRARAADPSDRPGAAGGPAPACGRFVAERRGQAREEGPHGLGHGATVAGGNPGHWRQYRHGSGGEGFSCSFSAGVAAAIIAFAL